MKQAIIGLMLLFAVVTINLDPGNLSWIYVGVYDDSGRVDQFTVMPDTANYDLEIDLKPGQEAYYLTYMQFGRVVG